MNSKILSSLTGSGLGIVGVLGLALDAEFSRTQLMLIFMLALVLTTFGADLSKLFSTKKALPPPE